MNNLEILADFLSYYEDKWIGRIIVGNQRRRPKFRIDLWNRYNLIQENIPLTNNSTEGWHNRFNQIISICHINIWDFISKIKDEQSQIEISVTQLDSGRELKKESKYYREKYERIQRIVSQYNENNILNYL